MTNSQSSYRRIFQATSIFGGVQIVSIGVGIIRTKFVAILLGPTGMGILALLVNTTGLINGLTNLGLGTSAVKDVAVAHSKGNSTRVAIVVKVLRRWIWLTGILGTVLTIILAPLLSKIAFGNHDYTFAFIWVSIILLLGQISSGQNVVLRGMGKIREMAKASLIGSILGLFTTIPLYYFLGLDGIVPGIILTALIMLLLTWHYSRKFKIQDIYVSKIRTFAEGKGMLKMGFLLSLNGMIANASSYLFQIYLSRFGGVDQVGLYNAGFALTNTYVRLIFNAMTMDYYPRLSAVAHSDKLSKDAINQQAEVAVLILAPIVLIFLVFINWVVLILYSNKFTAINDMILWIALGMLFKTASWSISILLLAKGASKLFFINNTSSNLYIFGLNIIGYYLGGLTGVGLSFMIGYIIVLIHFYFVINKNYRFTFSNAFIHIFSLQIILAISCFITSKLFSTPLSYLFGIILIIISSWYSYKEIDKRIDLKSLYRKYLKK